MKCKIIAFVLGASTLFMTLCSCNSHLKEDPKNTVPTPSHRETTALQETTEPLATPQTSLSRTHETRYYLLKNTALYDDFDAPENILRVLSSDGEITISYTYNNIYAVENPFTERTKQTQILQADDLIFVCRDGDQSVIREAGDEYELRHKYALSRDAALAYPDGRVLTDFLYSDSGNLKPFFIAPDLILVGMKGDKEIQVLSHPSLETIFSLTSEEEFDQTPAVFGDNQTLAVFESTRTTFYNLQSIRDGNAQVIAEFPGYKPQPASFYASSYDSEFRYIYLYAEGEENSDGVVDATGNWIVPPHFVSVSETPDPNYFIVYAGPYDDNAIPAQSGVYDVAAKELLIPLQNQYIKWYTKEVLCVQEARILNDYYSTLEYLCDSETLEPISAEYEYIDEPETGTAHTTAMKRDSTQGYLVGVTLDWRSGTEIAETPESDPEDTALTVDGVLSEPYYALNDRFSVHKNYENNALNGNICLFDAQTHTTLIPFECGYSHIFMYSNEEHYAGFAYVDILTDDVYFVGATYITYSFSRYTLMNAKGEVLIDNLNNIHLFDGDFLVADRGLYTGLMDLEGNWLWKASRFDTLVD